MFSGFVCHSIVLGERRKENFFFSSFVSTSNVCDNFSWFSFWTKCKSVCNVFSLRLMGGDAVWRKTNATHGTHSNFHSISLFVLYILYINIYIGPSAIVWGVNLMKMLKHCLLFNFFRRFSFFLSSISFRSFLFSFCCLISFLFVCYSQFYSLNSYVIYHFVCILFSIFYFFLFLFIFICRFFYLITCSKIIITLASGYDF